MALFLLLFLQAFISYLIWQLQTLLLKHSASTCNILKTWIIISIIVFSKSTINIRRYVIWDGAWVLFNSWSEGQHPVTENMICTDPFEFQFKPGYSIPDVEWVTCSGEISYTWWFHSLLIYSPWSPELLLFLWNIIFNMNLNCISVCLDFRNTSNREPFVYLCGGGGGEEDTLKNRN